MHCMNYKNIYAHCHPDLFRSPKQRVYNLNRRCRSKKGDAQGLFLKLQVYLVILLLQKKWKVSPRFLPSEQRRKKAKETYLFQGLGRKAQLLWKARGSHQPPRHRGCLKRHGFAPISAKDAQKASQGTELLLLPVGCCQNQGGLKGEEGKLLGDLQILLLMFQAN